jgi:hypothetical protein
MVRSCGKACHIVLLGCFLCSLGQMTAPGSAGAETADVRVEHVPDPGPGTVGLRGEQRYSIARGDLSASLSYLPATSSLILRVADRRMSLGEQASLLAPLLARLLLDHPGRQRFSLLLMDHSEVVRRLAPVLAACRNWNGGTGRPVQGALGQFLVDTLNRNDLASEIARVFGDLGYRFAVQGVSKITEDRVMEAHNKIVPTSIAYIGFVAELPSRTQGRTTWPLQFQRSTC